MGASLRGDMPQPGADWHQGRFPVREAAHNPCPPAYLAVESFKDIVCPDVAPVLAGEVEIRQRFAHALGVYIRSRIQFHLAQLAFYVLNLGKGGLTILLRIDRLEQCRHRQNRTSFPGPGREHPGGDSKLRLCQSTRARAWGPLAQKVKGSVSTLILFEGLALAFGSLLGGHAH